MPLDKKKHCRHWDGHPMLRAHRKLIIFFYLSTRINPLLAVGDDNYKLSIHFFSV